MASLLDYQILDNSVRDYLISFSVIAAIFLFKKLVSKMFASLIARLVQSRKRPFNRQRFLDLVLSPIELFVVVLAIMICFQRLNYPQALAFNIYKSSFHKILEATATGVLIVAFIWLCNRLIMYVADLLHEKALETEDRNDDQLVIFFRDFFKVILWIIGLLMVLKFSFDFAINNVFTGLSIVGAALALAFRESLENLIASFIIFFDKPFTIGDLVKVETVTGTIEKIGLRSTRIRTTEKTYTTVPNKKMVDTIVDNQSMRNQRNVSTTLEIGLETTATQLAKLVTDLELVLQRSSILDANVYLQDTGKNAHIIQVEYFVVMDISIKEFYKLRQEVNLAIISLLNAANIELAAEAGFTFNAPKK